MKIYLVAIYQTILFEPLSDVPDKRVVGYFLDLETAKQCIEENRCELNENGYYKYAVIEDVKPGLYKTSHSKPLFYKWFGDFENGGYKRIRRPKCTKGFSGFTIG